MWRGAVEPWVLGGAANCCTTHVQIELTILLATHCSELEEYLYISRKGPTPPAYKMGRCFKKNYSTHPNPHSSFSTLIKSQTKLGTKEMALPWEREWIRTTLSSPRIWNFDPHHSEICDWEYTHNAWCGIDSIIHATTRVSWSQLSLPPMGTKNTMRN